MNDYKKTHALLSEKVRARLPEHIARCSWTREQIHAFQSDALQDLIEHVRQNSPYYAKLLQNQNITLKNLATLPVLTKETVLQNWDDIVCVDDVTKAEAEAHLDKLRTHNDYSAFYKDKYYITATGGSSGLRGLYAWDLDYYVDIAANYFRYFVRDEDKPEGKAKRNIAVLTAPTAIHASTPLCTTLLDTSDQITHLPVDVSIQELCKQLNKLKPSHLFGYASVIDCLAKAAHHNELDIHPVCIITNSEPLGDIERNHIDAAWGIQPNNIWGSVEMGMAGIESHMHQGLILSEDMMILEPVDAELLPVQDPKKAQKLIVTNLFNKTLPLIRYVVDDVTIINKASYTNYRITDAVSGRTDDWFSYSNNIHIHPMIFWNVLELEPNISEFQIFQTQTGADIHVVLKDIIDESTILKHLKHDLAKAGLKEADIHIKQVEHLKRHAETAKLRRFVPL